MKQTKDIFGIRGFNTLCEATGTILFVFWCFYLVEVLPDNGFIYKTVVVFLSFFFLCFIQVNLSSRDNELFDKKFGRALSEEALKHYNQTSDELKICLEEVSNVFSIRFQIPSLVISIFAMAHVESGFDMPTAIVASFISCLVFWIFIYSKLKSINPKVFDSHHGLAFYEFLNYGTKKFFFGLIVMNIIFFAIAFYFA